MKVERLKNGAVVVDGVVTRYTVEQVRSNEGERFRYPLWRVRHPDVVQSLGWGCGGDHAMLLAAARHVESIAGKED